MATATEQMTSHLQTIVLESAPQPPTSGGGGDGTGIPGGVPASPSFVTPSISEVTRSRENSSASLASSAFGNGVQVAAAARNVVGSRRNGPGVDGPGQPHWQHRVSASFSALADQIAAAGKAIALMPPPSPAPGSVGQGTNGGDGSVVVAAESLAAYEEQLQEIQDRQQRLEEGLDALREKVQELEAGPEAVKKQLEDLQASIKLDQQRLAARLHNAICTASKSMINPVIGLNGKPPAQFPATRGEFEHLTKERYEMMLKSYGLPVTGDLAAKRAAVRAFIGCPEP